MMRAVACIAMLISLVVISFGPTTALATSQSGSDASCRVEPRATDELVALMFDENGTPVSVPEASMGAPVDIDLSQGEAVDAETATAVKAVVHQWLHCLANGQHGRALALMSDAYGAAFLATLYGDVVDSRDELRRALDGIAVATPTAELTHEFDTGGRSIVRLDDGRVGGIWTVAGDDAIVMLVQQDGAWTIDQVIDIDESATPER